ncbi:MAG: CDGSH iron-sulfur domain-containing protein [Hyphomicrobiaceae bacterium]
MSQKKEAAPIQVQLVAGEIYHWCTCGNSKTGAYCDGSSHEGTGCTPVTFTATKSEVVNLCGCRETDDPPFCDGTHNIL